MAWFAAKSPVSAEAGAWIERSLDWCADQFGAAVLHQPVQVPHTEFLPRHYERSERDVEDILGIVCARMGVDRQSIILELMPAESDPELLQHLPAYGRESAGEAGHYLRRGDEFVVAVAQDQLADPMAVVAVIAHEIGHVRLLGEGRIDHQRKDGEQLTDLVTVALGFGVFNANASFEFEQSNRGWQSSRLGYLNEQMFGYALAYHARLRRETDPAWSKALDLNPRSYMKQATRYLDTVG